MVAIAAGKMKEGSQEGAAGRLESAWNAEFKEKQIHQKVEVSKIDILDTRKISDGSGQSFCGSQQVIQSGRFGSPRAHRVLFRWAIRETDR